MDVGKIIQYKTPVILKPAIGSASLNLLGLSLNVGSNLCIIYVQITHSNLVKGFLRCTQFYSYINKFLSCSGCMLDHSSRQKWRSLLKLVGFRPPTLFHHLKMFDFEAVDFGCLIQKLIVHLLYPVQTQFRFFLNYHYYYILNFYFYLFLFFIIFAITTF